MDQYKFSSASRPFTALGLLGLLGMWIVGWGRVGAEETRPNILFLFSDDQSYEMVGALGIEAVETPHLDRLVAEGVSFTHAYHMGSWSPAVCVASRTMLNTGRFLWHAEREAGGKIVDNFVRPGRMWGQRMGAAGYDTYFAGKWHVPGVDPRPLFGGLGTVRGGMPNQTEAGYDRPLADGSDTWDPSDPQFGGFWAGGRHWSEVLADEAVGYLGGLEQGGAPFFAYVAFNAPHDPRQAPQDYVDRYPAAEVAVPASYLPEYPYNEAIGSGRGLRDEKLAPFPRTEGIVQVHRQEYFAIVSHMDTQVGRILEALEASGRKEETYIIFSSDHGLGVGHHGLMGKQNMYEHSMRVPLMVVGPGLEAGRKIDELVYVQDLMPTVLELGGAEVGEDIEFRSLVPLLRGEGGGYPSIYGAYLGLQRMLAEGGWKLILYPKAQVKRLYHLAEDPLEINDLAGEEAQLGRMRELFEELVRWQGEVGDGIDLGAVFPELEGGS